MKSWTNCIDQLGIEVEIAFLGDSITYGGNWKEKFPEKEIINLGYAGDSISGMIDLVEQIAITRPKKIFIMAGINGLKKYGVEETVKQYKELVDTIRQQNPDVKIYIQSILPISKEKECGTNEMISQCNSLLSKIDDTITYIDLHSLYLKDGVMNPDLTKDGIHLVPEAYEIWYNKK